VFYLPEWSIHEIDYIKINYPYVSAKDLADKLQRSLVSVRWKVHHLNIHKALPDDVCEQILDLVKRDSVAQISDLTGVSRYRINQILKQNNVKPFRHNEFNGWEKGVLVRLFQHKGNKNGKTRAQLLHAYNYTCWECKNIHNPKYLHVHHDFSSLPVKAVVVCHKCHKDKHGCKSLS